MKNSHNDWNSIIKNSGIVETSFGSISFLPSVQNAKKDYIHFPVKVSSLGMAKFQQYCKGERDE